jgi:tetratricopeptide (TPR) repeat protein
MSHLGAEALRRILGGAAGPQEAEAAAEHALFCDRCRGLAGSLLDELRARDPGLAGEGPLRLLFDSIDRERRWGVESLAALSEWTELRRLPSRRGQRERVRMRKACHTVAFFRLILADLREEPSWEEAEFLAGLALLCAEAMRRRGEIAEASHHDLQAEAWTAVANARRRAAEWQRAEQALSNAERHLKEGTGDPRLEAEHLSIAASIQSDQGQVSQALETLETCGAIHERLAERALLARTLVQAANLWAGIDPAKGLAVLDRAKPLVPSQDAYLTLLAELIRVECLIETHRPVEALPVFRRCSGLFAAVPGARMRIRGKFTGARLMDALGFQQQGERLLEEVVDRDVEHELYKDAYLDLLYLYGRHVKAGELDKAARVCQRALTDSALSAVAHEELRALWAQLLAAARQQAVGQEVLGELRRYLSLHWKHPAGALPKVSFR